MAHLNKPLLSELNILRREVRDLLTKRYSHPIAFEHGPGLPIGMGGGCIDHAHIHVLPSEIDLLPLLSKYDMKLIGDTNYTYEIERKDRPYLLYEDQRGHIYMGNGENVPSQFIRRIIANELGIPDQWDYAVFPKYELIEATIDKLTV
jgi:hypothetical protein